MIATSYPHSLRDYFDRIYWPRQLGKSPRTATLYRFAIDALGRTLERPALIDDLDDDTVTAHLSARLAAGLSAFSVSRERDKLLAVWRFAARKRHVELWPDVPQIRLPRRQPHAMTVEQVAALLTAARATPGAVGSVPAGVWWSAYHTVALTTGERTGAMLAIQWSHLRGDWLVVPGEIRKCGVPASYRLPPAALAVLGDLRQHATGDRVFAAPFCLCTFYNRNREILRRAGLPTGREWQPQVCRRTFASWLEASGGNATEALQHTSRATTKASYLDPTIAVAAEHGRIVADAIGLRSE